MLIRPLDILGIRPCFDMNYAVKHIGKGLPLVDFAEKENILFGERRWLIAAMTARTVGGFRALASWAAGCAQDVAHLADDQDSVRCAISVASAWADGNLPDENEPYQAAALCYRFPEDDPVSDAATDAAMNAAMLAGHAAEAERAGATPTAIVRLADLACLAAHNAAYASKHDYRSKGGVEEDSLWRLVGALEALKAQ